ncbi:hypothetical protein [Curtobacterium sp. 9128]|uniref:hypothetical protein n=1 Tax=Curtobacterium sp. 9128 TaxID=1793722 RepID=UPI0011A62B92|nr:hypothetical protein [Curtobacterium sp. 9128]
MGNEGYTETTGASRLFRVLGIATVTGSVGVGALVAVVPPTPGKEASGTDLVIASIALVLVAVLGVGLAASRLTVQVDDLLTVRMTPWYRRTINPRTITSASVVDLRGRAVGGWGVRLAPGQGTVVLMDDGPGVRLGIEGRRDLSFRCGDPERVLAVLTRQGAGTPTSRS